MFNKNFLDAVELLGFNSRLCEIISHLKGEFVQSDDPLSSLFQFTRILGSKNLSKTESLGLLLLGVSGSYFCGAKWDYWSERLEISARGDLIALISENASELLSLAKNRGGCRLVSLPAEALLCDVTNTVSRKTVSGVQRVVRNLVQSWVAAGVPVFSFVIEDRAGQPKLLNANWFVSEDGNRRQLSFKAKIRRLLVLLVGRDGLLYRVFRLLYNLVRLFLVELNLGSRDRYRVPEWFYSVRAKVLSVFDRFDSIVNKETHSGPIPILFRARMFSAEIIDSRRVEVYFGLKYTMEISLSLVCHDLIPIYFPEFCGPNDFPAYLRLMRIVDRVACVSHSVEREFRVFGKNISRKYPIRFAAMRLPWGFSINPAIYRAGQISDRPLILSVGTVETRKNYVNFIRAARVLKSRGVAARFKIIGNPGWQYELIYAEYEKARAEGVDITISSGLTDAELCMAYIEAHFVAFLSNAEGFGLPVAEALFFGKPCVISSVPCLSEFLDGGGCVQVDHTDVLAIADLFEDLITDSRKLEKLHSEIKKSEVDSWGGYSRSLYEFICS